MAVIRVLLTFYAIQSGNQQETQNHAYVTINDGKVVLMGDYEGTKKVKKMG